MDSLLQFTLAAAFLAGLAGGVHCAAMCGPVMGIACGPHGRSARGAAWLRRALAYNAGRLVTYVAAGSLTGAIGAAGLAVRGTPLTQQALLAVMSAAMIVMAAYVAGIAPLVRGIEAAGAVLWRRVQPYARFFLPVDTAARAFGLGLIWGWLPCGMVYMALFAALAAADPLSGGLIMAAFGLGTLPNVLAVSAWVGYVARAARGRLSRALIAGAIAAVGMLGIAKAVQPAVVSAGWSWCLSVPGVAALFGGGQ